MAGVHQTKDGADGSRGATGAPGVDGTDPAFIDMTNRILYRSNTFLSAPAYDWDNNLLLDTNSHTSIDVSGHILMAADGTTPTLDYTAQSALVADIAHGSLVLLSDVIAHDSDQDDKINAILAVLKARKLMASA